MGDYCQHATVEYVILSGSTETDAEIDGLLLLIRNSLREQFPCCMVTVAIEEKLIEQTRPIDGASYS
jgi:hypothetical protein